MTRFSKRRLEELEGRIRAIPLPVAVVRDAFRAFKETGELPDNLRLAYAVVHRSKRGATMADLYESTADWGTLIRAQMEAPRRPRDPVMDAVYNEAVFGKGVVRAAARLTLIGLAGAGFDPTEPQFVGHDLPTDGRVGPHLLGLPERLAQRPYVRQAKRLLARAAKIRAIVPHDPSWMTRLEHAAQQAQEGGGWPTDRLLLESTLVLGEVNALIRHAGGEDVAETMAAFDAAARAKGENREETLRHLQELVRGEQAARPSD